MLWICAILLSAALLITGLYMRIELVSADSELSTLSEQYEELRSENKRLQIEYWSLFTPQYLKSSAEALGMLPERSDRFIRIDTESGDKAVILR